MISKKTGFVALVAILTAGLALILSLFKTVNWFSLFDGDSCSRVLAAWEWAKSPTVRPLFDIWLNLQFWIVGFGLRLYSDPVVVPVIVNTIFFLGNITLLFLLTIELFPQYIAAAVLVAGLAAFHPFLLWLSLSGLDVHIFYFLTISGVFFWIKYIKKKRSFFLFLAAISFSLSAGVRYEAWIFTFIFSCLVLKELFSDIRERRSFSWPLFSCLIISWFFIVYWLIAQKACNGKYLYFLFRQYERVANEPVSIGVKTGEIFRNFLVRSVHFFPKIVTLFALGGMIRVSIRAKREIRHLILFIFIPYIILMGLFVFGLRGSWIEKSIGVTFLFLLPFCGFAVCSLFLTRDQRIQIIVVSLLIGVYFWFNLANNAYNPKYSLPCAGMERSCARQCAMILRSLYRTKALEANERVLLEQPLSGSGIYDGYFIRIISPELIVWDRDPDYVFKDRQAYLNTENNPSKLDFPAVSLSEFIKDGHFRIIIAVSEATKLRLEDVMHKISVVDGYSFYIRKDEQNLALDIKRRHAEITRDWYDRWLSADIFHVIPFWSR
jgi:hypothetical protein